MHEQPSLPTREEEKLSAKESGSSIKNFAEEEEAKLEVEKDQPERHTDNLDGDSENFEGQVKDKTDLKETDLHQESSLKRASLMEGRNSLENSDKLEINQDNLLKRESLREE